MIEIDTEYIVCTNGSEVSEDPPTEVFFIYTLTEIFAVPI